jgi:hypothetical protein
MILCRRRNVVQLGIDVAELTGHPVVRHCPELGKDARSGSEVDAFAQVSAGDPLRNVALHSARMTLQERCAKKADEFVAYVRLVKIEGDEL